MKSVIFLVITAIRREHRNWEIKRRNTYVSPWREAITDRVQITKKQIGKNNKGKEEGVT